MSSKIWHGLLAAFAILTLAVDALAQQPPSIGKQQLFPTPEAAADALNDAAKRGDGAAAVDVDEISEVLALPLPEERLIALDAALQDLAKLHERQARIVELRYFGGLSVEETAEVLEISPTTVKREWATARAWLFRAVDST